MSESLSILPVKIVYPESRSSNLLFFVGIFTVVNNVAESACSEIQTFPTGVSQFREFQLAVNTIGEAIENDKLVIP